MTYSDNCSICGVEHMIDNLKPVTLAGKVLPKVKLCYGCLDKSDPADDYISVRKLVLSQLASTNDVELSSPSITITPPNPEVQKAVDIIKNIQPSYFVGVRKIELNDKDTHSGAFGNVNFGGSDQKDPTIIHLNYNSIKSSIESRLGSASPEEKKHAIIESIVAVIAHETGHIRSFKGNAFQGAEAPAEQEENRIKELVKAIKF